VPHENMTAMNADELWEDPRHWVPEVFGGLFVLGLGLTEAFTTDYITSQTRLGLVWIAVLTSLAVSLSRWLPSAALGIVWLVCGFQLISSVQVMLVQLTMAVVAFGAARWGRPLTVFVSGLSIPLAGVLVTTFASPSLFAALVNESQYKRIIDAVQVTGTTWQFAAALIGTTLLAAPWLAGLALRYNTRATESRISELAAQAEAERAGVESEQSREIARLREEQARLARDVHDVVGHSLAVILAQAEAAQFQPDDPARLKATMATIATSARSSLQDVRQVLSATKAPAPPRARPRPARRARRSGTRSRGCCSAAPVRPTTALRAGSCRSARPRTARSSPSPGPRR